MAELSGLRKKAQKSVGGDGPTGRQECLPAVGRVGRSSPPGKENSAAQAFLSIPIRARGLRQHWGWTSVGRGAVTHSLPLYGLTANTQSINTPIVRWRAASTGCSDPNRYTSQRLSSAKTKRKKRNHPPDHGCGDWPRRSILAETYLHPNRQSRHFIEDSLWLCF